MIIKSLITMKDITQSLSNGKRVFDFSKIKALGFPIHLMMTERGAKGKTVNSKELMRKLYEETGNKSMFLMNTTNMIKATRKKFLLDMRKPFVRKNIGTDFWNKVTIKGDPDKLDMYAYAGNGNPFIHFMSLSQAESLKNARELYEVVVWDEFNVNFNRVQKAADKFGSLLHTLEDVVTSNVQKTQLFIFGNSKSLNNPIIYNMGVTHVEHEISELIVDNGTEEGFKLMLIISPKFDNKQRVEIEEDNKNNWVYQVSKTMGDADHAYFNDSLYDEVNNIRRYADTAEKAKLLTSIVSIHHNGEYFNIYSASDTGNFHIIAVDKSDIWSKVLFIFNKRDIIENARYNRAMKKQLYAAVADDLVTFEDVVSRALCINSLRK